MKSSKRKESSFTHREQTPEDHTFPYVHAKQTFLTHFQSEMGDVRQEKA